MKTKLIACTLVLGLFSSTAASAQAVSEKAVETFNSRARQMISAADSDPTDTQIYLSQLKSSCGGLVGDLMAARMPNAAGIQLQAFCMGVNDLERAVNATKSGRNAYCGDFDQGIRAARKMVRGPENDGVYDTAQALATAAERIKSIEFNGAKHVGWGLGAAEKLQTMSCN